MLLDAIPDGRKKLNLAIEGKLSNGYILSVLKLLATPQ